jgi:hypothetical protein
MRTPSADNVGVTFVNMLVGRGTMNGVVNLTFATFNFTPNDAENKVEQDSVISARLRMDIPCARQLHKVLGDLLDNIDNAAMESAPPAPTSEGVASGKPN